MIGDDLTAALPELRAAAESLMTDTCHIRRETGETTDPDSGKITPGGYVDIYGTEAAPGKCRVKAPKAGLTDRTVGEQYVQLAHPELQVPVTAVGSKDGDEVVMMTSADGNLDAASRATRGLDPATFKVSGMADGSQQVMRRYVIEDAT